MYKIEWTLRAELTYEAEINFILLKEWPFKEVEKFIALVEDKIQLLRAGTITGKTSSIEDVRILVISKQTSLAYKIFEDELRIELLTFWNNTVDPRAYDDYLEI
ncbi:hypothetical protein [uncultured Dokdonia sp.]|uniref:hypothetical protein n=1 Tax=uncultured Dokdonia sp. TaxID=575653 RepID=UPI00262B6F1B|nr:hypothetical protein [uncultured Dokdonia sp.]